MDAIIAKDAPTTTDNPSAAKQKAIDVGSKHKEEKVRLGMTVVAGTEAWPDAPPSKIVPPQRSGYALEDFDETAPPGTNDGIFGSCSRQYRARLCRTQVNASSRQGRRIDGSRLTFRLHYNGIDGTAPTTQYLTLQVFLLIGDGSMKVVH